jgi:hypothetical protein
VDRQTRNLFLLGIGLFVVVFGGAAILLSSTQLRDPAVPSGAATAVGVITHLETKSLGAVTSMTLRTTEGQTIDFVIGRLENEVEFPLGHLATHQATGQPVRVWYRMEGSQRVAFRIEDAVL